MKTLVMTLVMVTTGMANVVADNATQRFAYNQVMDGANYQCYNWDAEAGNWDLQLEHRVGEEVRLYAGK